MHLDLQSDDRRRLAEIVSHPGTMATVLYVIGLREFGEEMHSWEPETVHLEFRDAFGVDMPEVCHDKLMAILSALKSNAFYVDWASFEVICRTINTGEPYSDDELLVAEMAWAVIEVALCDETPSGFSDDIKHGVGALLAEEGFTTPPAKLSFAVMPDSYIGSSTPEDIGKSAALSTEHAAVVADYLAEQSVLLVRQLTALPWNNEEVITQVFQEVMGQ